MSDILRKCILGILALILSCSTAYDDKLNWNFSFVPSTKKPTTFKSKKRIAIQTFTDEREKENISYGYLLLIPLVPYVNEYHNRPELAYEYNINFFLETDLAKAMKTELESYSIFEKVFYTDRTFPKDADYLIRARIKKNQIYDKKTMYGINTLALEYYIFVMLLEMEIYATKAEFELELIDLKTKQIAFTKKFEKEESDIEMGFAKKKLIGKKFLSLNEIIILIMSEEIIKFFEENKK